MNIFYFNSPLGVLKGNVLDGALAYLGFLELNQDMQKVSFENKFILKCKLWLDNYFNGHPGPIPELSLQGTDFQKRIWALVGSIPFGKTSSYKDITIAYLKKYNQTNLCNRATGHAVGLNPIAIIIPCHRVVRSDGATGNYHYGTGRKKYLLELEQSFMQK